MTTTPDSAAQGGVTVTQADREIAAGILEGPPWRHDRMAAMVRAGKADDDQLVRCAAQSRLASSPPAQQAGVEDALREALTALVEVADACAWSENTSMMNSAIDRARAALRPSTDAAAQLTDAGVRHPWSVGDVAYYTGLEPPMRVTIVNEEEGWWNVRVSDGSTCIVRPSRLAATPDSTGREEANG